MRIFRARPLISHTIAVRWLSGTSRCDRGGSFGTAFYRARLYRGKVARITAQMPRNGASGRRVSWGAGQLGITQWLHNENILRDDVGIKRGDYSSERGSVFLPPLCVFLY